MVFRSKFILWIRLARGLFDLRSSFIIRWIWGQEMPDESITEIMSMMA
jgi:hypothetical protein